MAFATIFETRVQPFLRDASVYVDDAQASAWLWSSSVGVSAFLAHGALSVKQLSARRPLTGLADQKRKLFLISTHISLALPAINIIVSASSTHTLTVLSTTPYRYPPSSSSTADSRDELISDLKELMTMSFVQAGQPPPEIDALVVNIEYYPMNVSCVCDDLMVLRGPSYSDNLSDTLYGWRWLPLARNGQQNALVREFAVELFGLLECLEVRPEIWHRGAFSGHVGRELVQMRDKLEINDYGKTAVSLLLLDRTLDIKSLCGDTNNLLFQLYNVLPRHAGDESDLEIPVPHLLPDKWGTIVHTSLSHELNDTAARLLSQLVSLDAKDGMAEVRRTLIDITITEGVQVKLPRILGKVTFTQLEKIIIAIYQHASNSNYELLVRHQPVLSIVEAVLSLLKENHQQVLTTYTTTVSMIHTIVSNVNQASNEIDVLQSIINLLQSISNQLSIRSLQKLVLLAVTLLAKLPERQSSNNSTGWIQSIVNSVMNQHSEELSQSMLDICEVIVQYVKSEGMTEQTMIKSIFEEAIISSTTDISKSTLLTHISALKHTTPIRAKGYFGGISRLLSPLPAMTNSKTIIIVMCGSVTWKELSVLREITSSWKEQGNRLLVVGYAIE